MGFSNFIKKIQGLSESKRKIIFYTVIIFSGSLMICLLAVSAENNIMNVVDSKKTIDFPKIDTKDIDSIINSIDTNELSSVSGEDSNKINWK